MEMFGWGRAGAAEHVPHLKEGFQRGHFGTFFDRILDPKLPIGQAHWSNRVSSFGSEMTHFNCEIAPLTYKISHPKQLKIKIAQLKYAIMQLKMKMSPKCHN